MYKNKILDLTNELSNKNEIINNKIENENININYQNKINNLENQLEKLEKENLNLKNKENEENKKIDNILKKVNNDLKNTEYLIDKRVISSVLVNYFDKNTNENIKQSLLETLSGIMQYSNEDRIKMGLKPVQIPKNDDNNNNNDKLKNFSYELYNFIINN